jgi:hypothetical protein
MSAKPLFTIRIPRFLIRHPIAAGDAMATVTAVAGIPPCSACNRRAAKLNRLLGFVPNPRRTGRSHEAPPDWWTSR